jgi:hypothetical protein
MGNQTALFFAATVIIVSPFRDRIARLGGTDLERT